MRSRVWICGAMLALAAMTPSARAQTKVAVVDLDRLIKAHPQRAFAESVLKQQMDDFEKEQRELQAEGDRLREEFEVLREQVEDKALSETARDEKLAQARLKLARLQEMERRARERANKGRQELADNELRMRRQIVAKIRDVVAEYARQNQIGLVLDRSALAASQIEAVLYAAPSTDITAEILKRIGGKEGPEPSRPEGR